MNTIIKAYQPIGENVVEFTYKSGVKRYAYPNGWAWFDFTKTQHDFMQNLSNMKETEYGTTWIRKAE